MSKVRQTITSFGDKWSTHPDLAREATVNPDSEIYSWILERNGFDGEDEFGKFISSKRRILDAGCGNGRVTNLLLKYSSPEVRISGIDINPDIARAYFEKDERVEILKKDLLENLSDLGNFDYIYCQEVLHHTSDPYGAFKNLAGLLAKNGEIAIYVYKKKGPIREFTDEFIRSKIEGVPYSETLSIMSQIAEFGRILSEKKIVVEVPAIDILEIKSGEYDIQRLIYHFFFKCFWNSDLSLEDNIAINADWYHPSISSKHTLTEVLEWFKLENLEVVHQVEDEYGITIRGISK